MGIAAHAQNSKAAPLLDSSAIVADLWTVHRDTAIHVQLREHQGQRIIDLRLHFATQGRPIRATEHGCLTAALFAEGCYEH